MFGAFIGATLGFVLAWALYIGFLWAHVWYCRRYVHDDESHWYAFTREDDSPPSWRYRSVFLNGPKTSWSAEWSLFQKNYRFGFGFKFGRNGSDSDIGLDLHLGFVGNIYFRLRAPWTRMFKITNQSKDYWYEARHYGFGLFPYKGCIVQFLFGEYNGIRNKSWRELKLTTYKIMGRQETKREEIASGTTHVPMTEGNYIAFYMGEVTTHRYRFGGLGWFRDRIFGPERRQSYNLDIVGGIPVEGKGENSWDCGIDGVFGTSGRTLDEAVGNAVSSVRRMRDQYGGPHDLTQPTTVRQIAEARGEI